MAVYCSSTVTCDRDNTRSLHQESMSLNQQQRQKQQLHSFSSSAGSLSEIIADVRNEMVFIPPTGDVTALQNLNANVTENAFSSSDLSFHGQGLSLSLGTHIPSTVSLPTIQYQYPNMSNYLGYGPSHSVSAKETFPFNVDESCNNKEMVIRQPAHIPSSGFSGFYNNYQYEMSGLMSSVLRSRYLKPTQQLLDEVVKFRKDMQQVNRKDKNNKGRDFYGFGDSSGSATNGEAPNASEIGKTPELSPPERQDMQNKKTKLQSMVDEVDKRYNQYYQQMEALVSSFEMVAGIEAAKPYTSVALNRISRHFRSLRDAIKGQIQTIREKLEERESAEDIQRERIPRLRYLDQRIRRRRAMQQQLGMARPAWRPQRGLPENAVSILRAWLFEHFLHPYPKESEKIMLAKQTRLSKNQVSNWFINARVRLWKPMIEEMYKDEFGGHSELVSKSSHGNSEYKDKFGDSNTNHVLSEPKPDESQTQMIRSVDYENLMNYHGFNVDDYPYPGLGSQQDSRFSNSHHIHDFVV